MTVLYAYRQTIERDGGIFHHITFSETHPKKCKHAEPVECLGKIKLSELHYTESKDEPLPKKEPKS